MKIKIILLLFAVINFSCGTSPIPEKEGFLDVNKNKIHFKSQGEGEPILLLHGGYLNLDMWDTQVEYFTKNGYQVIRYSDLGHGKTQTVDDNCYGYQIMNELLEHFSIHKINIIGLSWGSMLGVDYCLKYPNKVNKLVLVSPGLNGWEYFKDKLAEQNYLERKIAIENGHKLEAANLFYKNWVVGPRRDESSLDLAFRQKAKGLIENTMMNHWKENWSKLDSTEAITQLSKIKTKTLIIRGDQDANDITAISEKYNLELANSALITFQNTAHSINLEQPKLFNEVVLNFLRKDD